MSEHPVGWPGTPRHVPSERAVTCARNRPSRRPGIRRLWDEARTLVERSGNAEGKATIAQNKANALLQRGERGKAIEILGDAERASSAPLSPTEQAAELSNKAALLLSQGDAEQAIKLWNRAIVLSDQAGHRRGRGIVLHNMASAWSQQGEFDKANALWLEALQIAEDVADVRLSVAILVHLAQAAKRGGDSERWLALSRDAASRLVAVCAWTDLLTLVLRVAGQDTESSVELLAQGTWLVFRVGMPLEKAVIMLRAFLDRAGPASSLAPSIAAAALLAAQTVAGNHPQAEAAEQLFAHRLIKCAEVRGIEVTSKEQLEEWVTLRVLNKSPVELHADLISGLESLIRPNAWLFDRSQIPYTTLSTP